MINSKLNGLVCLIIEQDNAAARILAAKLLKGGFSSSHFHSCKTALDVLKHSEEHFDAILINTGSATSEILAFPAGVKSTLGSRPVPPILSYSYIRDSGDVSKFLKAGYSDCFSRPIQPDLLWEKVEAAINPALEHRSRVFAAEMLEPCRVSLEFEMVSINEVGVELLSSVSLEVGALVRVESPTFRDCGVETNDCRVASQREIFDSLNNKQYKVLVKFVSLTPEQRNKLRLKSEFLVREQKKSK